MHVNPPTPPDLAQLAETLRQSEERLQLALEAGGMGIWQIDLPSRRSTWWPGMERLHGLPEGSEPLHGDSYLEVVDPRDRDRFKAAVDESIQRTGWHRIEYRVVWPDGSVRWLEARARVRRDASGQPALMAGVLLDITRRKHT